MEEQVVQKQGNITTIDLPKLMQIKTEEIIIQYERSMSEKDLFLLVPFPHIFRNPKYPPEKVVTPIEITVDYANTWINRYETFQIRNIRKEYYLELHGVNINDLLPLLVKTKLKEITDMSKTGPNEVKILNKISRIFEKFETDKDIQNMLSEVVSTDKSSNVEFSDTKGKIEPVIIHGHKIKLPKSLNMMCIFNLDGKDLTLSANLIIDTRKMNSIITDLAEESKEYLESLDI